MHFLENRGTGFDGWITLLIVTDLLAHNSKYLFIKVDVAK